MTTTTAATEHRTLAEIQTLVAHLQGPRILARILTPDNVQEVYDTVAALLIWAEQHGIDPARLSVVRRGGIVPNGYRYRADATMLIWDGSQPSPWKARRDSATRAKGGRGWLLCIELRNPENADQNLPYQGIDSTAYRGVRRYVLKAN